MKRLHPQGEVCITHGERLKPETYGASEMMEILKVSRQTLAKRTEESRAGLIDMPAPFTEKFQRPVWCAQAIRDWISRRMSVVDPPPSINIPTAKQTLSFNARQKIAEQKLLSHAAGRRKSEQ